ncbi:replication protein A subunit RPA32 [Mycena pura]|uniref:Replication protein A subunit RPA32 n=1 Tax=Mycena pura TaxID=153505 RepID=A0AAD6VWB9_9AGAR|nr:replication protein A subunit RPA32 [Mycena pura]
MSQYSNSPGGGGGGFTPGSQGSPSGFQKSGASLSMRAVTIAQVRKATQLHADAEWKLDDKPVGQINLVAEVHEHTAYATNRTFLLDDGTGRITAKFWMDIPSEQQKVPWRGIPVGNDNPVYVRVIGYIKSHGGKKFIHILNMRLVNDPSEVYFHILDCIYVHVVLQKGLPPASGQDQPIAGQGQSAYNVQSRPALEKLFSPLADSIMHYLISQAVSPDGVHVADIAKALKCDAIELSDTVEKMIDNGNIFTTIDESHISPAS